MSFIAPEPQSRIVLESHSGSLLAQFDTQLQIISDRYLAFFQERRRIEVTYIDSLRKLHRKATTIDASFDPRAIPTTTRSAWDKVRDNIEREASTQQTFVNILDHDVIKPLEKLKKSEDETRKRIEEALTASTAGCADHAEITISRLQQAYSKKYHPRQHAQPIDVSQRTPEVPNKWFGGVMASNLFRGLREPVKVEEVSDDDFRNAVSQFNTFQSTRAEDLKDGYECLQELVFTPTIKDVLISYVDGMITACAMHDNLAKSTQEKVKNALTGTDRSDLRASFRRALLFAIPPRTLYSNYCPGSYSDLIFGLPIVDVTTTGNNVPKVMRMCIEEVEKRGLNTNKIYSCGSIYDVEVLQLRRRFESDKNFLFNSTDNIHFVAILLKRYLWDLPGPLLVLSLHDYRNYRQNRARYTKNGFSLLRSKIRELHPVQRASLGDLLRHLFRVASHSNKNAMTVEELAAHFRYAVFRGNVVLQDDVHVKGLVLEDLIQNAYTLFDDRPFPSPPFPTPNATETISTHSYDSFISPELPQPAEVQAMGSTTRHRPGLVGGNTMSTQSSFPSIPSDAAMEIRPTRSQTPILIPQLGVPMSKTSTEGVETTTQEQVIPEGRGIKVVERLTDSTPPEVVSVSSPPTSVAEWVLHQSRRLPFPEMLTIPQSPESVLSSTSYFPLSSATSLQTETQTFYP